jgi:mono/diheme cytochrome c family protein
MTRKHRIRSLAVLAFAAGAAFAMSSCGPKAGEQAGGADSAKVMTAEAKIELGRHLTVVAGCIDCHTPGTLYGKPDMTRNLAGSELGWTGPWGTTYPTNLTPDSTGIGWWTEEQIVTAFRTGVRPDGSPVLPPMPWPSYAEFTDEEAYAIAAYIKSLPPVHHPKVKTLPPGQRPASPTIQFPPPSAWDAPRGAPDSAAAGQG